MKIVIVSLLVASVAFSAEARNVANLDQYSEKMQTKFEDLVMREANQIISDVKKAEYSLRKDVQKFIQREESKINSSVATATEVVNVMTEGPLECYVKATKELMAAQEAALANLLACQEMSQAYQDVEEIAEKAGPVIADVIADAAAIVDGVVECVPQSPITMWACVMKYISREMANLRQQWPEAKKFISEAEELGMDVVSQVTECLNDPSQVNLEKRIMDALDEFSNCSQSMDTIENGSKNGWRESL